MSDVSQEPREWRFYVNDMIEFAEKVQLFTDGGWIKTPSSATFSPMMPLCGTWN